MLMFDFSKALITTEDKTAVELSTKITETKDGFSLTVKAKDIPENAEYIDISPNTVIANAGDDGYFVMPFKYSSFLCEFKAGEDCTKVYDTYSMPIFGYKKGEKALLAVISGLAWEHKIIIKRENNKFYVFPRFDLSGHGAYEDIVIEFFELSGNAANYVGMAKRYRNYQREKGAFKTLEEKIAERPSLKGIADSVNIRIRMGWKPVPSEIAEQTVENEPEMKVAMSFERLCELIDEMQNQGIKNADICLVGWNQKGHDGRWPQMFPVEEALGGEEGLKKAIEKAEKAGYTINAHTNSSDAYSIADNFNLSDSLVKKDGEICTGAFAWSGGKPYIICPERAYKNCKSDLERVRALGFKGMHYIDVLGTVPPRDCYSKEHPLTKKQGGKYFEKILEEAKTLFGGISSEGGHDYLIGVLDYGLYTCSNLLVDLPEDDPFINAKIPLYQLVYHGTILYCPSGDTINCTMGDTKKILKLVEYGGRPAIYVYQQFMDMKRGGFEFLGKVNPICDTDEDLRETAEVIKKAETLYNALESIRYSAMVNHEKLAEGVFKTTYENGCFTVVNYNATDYVYGGDTVKSQSWIIK